IHRFIGDFKLNQGQIIISDKETVGQIKRVLRLKIGDTVELVVEKSNLSWWGRITNMPGSMVEVDLIETKTPVLNNQNEVTLFCAVLKKDNFELVVQKTTELGVSKIVPIITTRTVKNNLKFERLQKIAKEAAEQSGRFDIPEITRVQKLEDVFKILPTENYDKIFWLGFGQEENKIILDQKNHNLKIALFVGPEGGFTNLETEKALELGFNIKTISANVLRAETAATVGVFASV
ncbi:MAG: RsmE family RNA methyltransferase, partial [Candidatus Paceibacterota bacterium]